MQWTKNINWQEWLKEENIEVPKGVNPIISCEGVDASGKSSTIEILLDVIKHTFLLHTSAPLKGSTVDYYQKVLKQSVELMKVLNQPFIADRFHIGEAVYGSIFRGYEFNYEEIEEELLKLGAKHIYVKADEEVILERLRKRGDWYIKLEDVRPIMQKYEEELKKSKLPIYVLDTTNDIQPEDIKNLIKFIYS